MSVCARACVCACACVCSVHACDVHVCVLVHVQGGEARLTTRSGWYRSNASDSCFPMAR